MRMFTIVFFLAVLVATSPASAAQETIVNFAGHSWEDGRFPPSLVNDELQAVGIVIDVMAPLNWYPGSFSYTWYMHSLISGGESVFGTLHVVPYVGGQFSVYADANPGNHDYGINPPNATVPSSFIDGQLWIEGDFVDFTMTYNDATSSGGFTGTINFTGGDVLPLLRDPEGWTFGSTIAGVSPVGYDLQMNGNVYLQGPISVEELSWAGIKSLYF